jgi:hypothetical protein
MHHAVARSVLDRERDHPVRRMFGFFFLST